MAGYLRMQQGGMYASDNIDVVAGAVFFHMWQNRQHPFLELTDGDTVYLVDGESRTIRWECRVANLRKLQYSSLLRAFEQLDQLFGVSPADCNDYVWSRVPEGWLMAFSVEVVRPLSIALPKDLNFVKLGGRNGWVAMDKLDSEALTALGLPPEGATAVALPAQVNDSTAAQSGHGRHARGPDRYIPQGVKRLVLTRDGRRCNECGRDDADMKIHFDHIFPWVKGGSNTPSNLQILCAEHNLKKGARILPGVERPSDAWDADGWSDEIQRIHLLRAAAAAGDVTAAFELAGDVPDEEAAELLGIVLESDRSELTFKAAVELARIEFDRENLKKAELLAHQAHDGSDPGAAAEAALVLVYTVEDAPEEKVRLLQQAMGSEEQWVRSMAALDLASLIGEESGRRVDLLHEAMKSPDRGTRAHAAFQLSGSATDEDKEQLLYEALGAESDYVREYAALEIAVLLYTKGRRTPVIHLLDQARRSSIPGVVEDAQELRTIMKLDD